MVLEKIESLFLRQNNQKNPAFAGFFVLRKHERTRSRKGFS